MLLGYWGSEIEDTNQIKLSRKNLNSTLQRRKALQFLFPWFWGKRIYGTIDTMYLASNSVRKSFEYSEVHALSLVIKRVNKIWRYAFCVSNYSIYEGCSCISNKGHSPHLHSLIYIQIRESYVKRRAKEVLYYKITSNFFYNAAIDSDRSPGLKFSPEV